MITQPLIQNIDSFSSSPTIQIDVLRLDNVHSVVSGNKWYKLKYYLKAAQENCCSTIVTFGGAYSNHIVATAFVCNKMGLKSIGIIRGEKPLKLSHTLQDAANFGMNLVYVNREVYRNNSSIIQQYSNPEYYIIPEGGYGELGAKGASEILSGVEDIRKYTHIICSCGTGTMMAGIIQSVKSYQTVIGINVLKGFVALEHDIRKLLPASFSDMEFEIVNDYHFGGYAKKTNELIVFMNNLFHCHDIPTDFVYSSKLFFAVKDLISKNYFRDESKILVVHCGGLQGNLSLPEGTLNF